ncbi:MAG: hypothetical protein ACXWQO_09930 [Bdellovibrionota bacterium]
MKLTNVILSLATVALMGITSAAQAGGESSAGVPGPKMDRDTQILQHPVVAAINKMLNDKYAGACQTPGAEKINWYCTGAIPPVKEPTIFPNGCGFSLEIYCPSETVTIRGHVISYSLVSPKPNHVKPTDENIIFSDVNFAPRN